MVDELGTEAVLTKFRENLSDVLQPHHNDQYLLRWLRARCLLVARKFDLQKSEDMLRTSLIWRKQVGADNILEWKVPEVILKYCPGGIAGFGKEGHPVWIERAACFDVKGLLKSVKRSDLVRYKIFQAEANHKLFREQSSKLNKVIDGMVLIWDMESFGMKHLWGPAVSFGQEILSMFEANYPETLYKTYVINAPLIFPIAFNLAKPFLSEDTRRKTEVLSSSWKEQLLQVIDADQLPVHWGGTATDPDGDEYCKSKIPGGGDVDAKYFVTELNVIDRSTFTRVFIPQRGSSVVSVTVEHSKSLLRWRFMTESHDIAFSIIRCSPEGTDGPVLVMVPLQRYNCHLIAEDGSITCPTAGVYSVCFDNTFSWLTDKVVFYEIDVLPPDDCVAKSS